MKFNLHSGVCDFCLSGRTHFADCEPAHVPAGSFLFLNSQQLVHSPHFFTFRRQIVRLKVLKFNTVQYLKRWIFVEESKPMIEEAWWKGR
jgi:hypothetical protein